MAELQPFDPDGPHAERLFDLYTAGNEEDVDDSLFDSERETIPVCMGSRYLRALAVVHTTVTHPPAVPTPNLSIRMASDVYDLWFIPTIDREESKAANLRLMVMQSLAHNLKGRPTEVYPNPFLWPGFRFQDEVVTLTAMRTRLSENDIWVGTTLHPELLSRGGSSTSPAKSEASRRNALAATAAKRKKRAAEDDAFYQAVKSGQDVEDLAAQSGRSVEAVRRAIARAELRWA